LGGNFWCGWRYLKKAANDTLLGIGQGKKDLSGHDTICGLT
jgi:hypothetical protein